MINDNTNNTNITDTDTTPIIAPAPIQNPWRVLFRKVAIIIPVLLLSIPHRLRAIFEFFKSTTELHVEREEITVDTTAIDHLATYQRALLETKKEGLHQRIKRAKSSLRSARIAGKIVAFASLGHVATILIRLESPEFLDQQWAALLLSALSFLFVIVLDLSLTIRGAGAGALGRDLDKGFRFFGLSVFLVNTLYFIGAFGIAGNGLMSEVMTWVLIPLLGLVAWAGTAVFVSLSSALEETIIQQNFAIGGIDAVLNNGVLEERERLALEEIDRMRLEEERAREKRLEEERIATSFPLPQPTMGMARAVKCQVCSYELAGNQCDHCGATIGETTPKPVNTGNLNDGKNDGGIDTQNVNNKTANVLNNSNETVYNEPMNIIYDYASFLALFNRKNAIKRATIIETTNMSQAQFSKMVKRGIEEGYLITVSKGLYQRTGKRLPK